MRETTKEKKKLEGAKFIHDRNKWFVRGEEKLASQTEIMRHIHEQLYPRPKPKLDGFWGYVNWVGGGLLFAPSGTFMLIASIVAVLQGKEFSLEEIVVFFGASILTTGMGWFALIFTFSEFWTHRRWGKNTRPQYEALIEKGEFIPARVMKIEPTIMGGAASIITYYFETPRGREIVSTQTTNKKLSLMHDDKVVVLYLDDRVHVLL